MALLSEIASIALLDERWQYLATKLTKVVTVASNVPSRVVGRIDVFF